MSFKIGNRQVGLGFPCFIVAELSANHGGSLDRAKQIIDSIKNTGADAVKLQTYTAETITLNCESSDFYIPSDNPWSSKKKFYNLFKDAYLPWEWHREIFEYAKSKGLIIFSSPFDISAVNLLEELDCPVYKIASPEITDIPLIMAVAKTKKPVIISTGVANKDDIDLAIKTLEEHGCDEYAILKCTSFYPAPPESINLKSLQLINETYKCPVGLSDHTIGNEIPIAAVALGANIIEKHFIDDNNFETHDSFFSSDEEQFKNLVNHIRNLELSLGVKSLDMDSFSQKNIWSRRSLYPSKSIKKGEVLNSTNLQSVRPYYGIHPRHYFDLLGKRAIRDIVFGERIQLEDFE